jgi:tripartite-type tricarboxylate transporter receptor subunit TctC
MKNLPVLILCALLGLAMVCNAADPYPAKPIRAIVPFPSGQGADILMRLLAEPMSKELGQQIVVENRPGTGGALGTAVAAKAPADGYTLYMGSSGPLAISPALYANVGYDPVKDFDPIGNVAAVAQVLVAGPALQAESLRQLMDMARKTPGQIPYASAGNGSTSHLTMELLSQQAGIKLSHVPYKGSPPALVDIIGGRIPVMFDAAPGVMAHLKSGKLRALAVSLASRSALLPEVPTVAEAGVPGFSTMGWIGLLAPAGTPAPILDRLNGIVLRIVAAPESKKRFAELGFTPIGGSRAEFASFIKAELELWGKVVKVSGAKVE